MKKIFQPVCLIILFSVILLGCGKDPDNNTQLFNPYEDLLNPPDSFIYVIPLKYSILQGKIQFKEDAVWHIVKTTGVGANTWLVRINKNNPVIFGLTQNDTVALQGNIPYWLSASTTTTSDGVNIYFMFNKLNRDYQSFSKKY